MDSLRPLSNLIPNFSNLIPTQVSRTLAIQMVALGSLAMLPTADGGPVAYSLCIVPCSAITCGAFFWACIAACSPALALPTP